MKKDINPVVEFLYIWTMKPMITNLVNENGTIIKTTVVYREIEDIHKLYRPWMRPISQHIVDFVKKWRI